MLAAGGLSVLLGTRGRGKRPLPALFLQRGLGRGRAYSSTVRLALREYPPLDVVAHRPRQGQALDVAALGDQVLGVVGVVDRLDALGDDRPFVEVVVDVVGGGADQLHALW